MTKRCTIKFIFTAETADYDIPTNWTKRQFIRYMTPIVKEDPAFPTIQNTQDREIEFVPLTIRRNDNVRSEDEASMTVSDDAWYNDSVSGLFYYVRFVV
jgi:hypothetical protein